jgi:glucan phosphoethanolaminetransferase (alkaline phosphatase superfamily)
MIGCRSDTDVTNKCSLEQLYNTYDNTILYVDHVVLDMFSIQSATFDRAGSFIKKAAGPAAPSAPN